MPKIERYLECFSTKQLIQKSIVGFQLDSYHAKRKKIKKMVKKFFIIIRLTYATFS